MSENERASSPPPNSALAALAASEDPSRRKARTRSLWIAHGALCIFSLGFSIVLTGVYPYMKQVKAQLF